MAIETMTQGIPPKLQVDYSRSNGTGQLRQGMEVAHLVGEHITVSYIEDGMLQRTSGRLARTWDSSEFGEDEHGNDGYQVTRTVLWFQDVTNPLVLNWMDIRECVVEYGGSQPW